MNTTALEQDQVLGVDAVTTAPPPPQRPSALDVLTHARPLIVPAVCASSTSGLGWLLSDFTPQPASGHLASVGVGAGVMAVMTLRERDRQRGELIAVIARAISAHTGEARVRARSWEGRWVGTPRRLTIRYDPRADTTGKWATTVAAAIGARLDRPARVEGHDPRRRRLTVRVLAPTPPPAAPPVPWLADRVDELIKSLFTDSAKHALTWDGSRLVAVDVQHKVGLRVSPHVLVRAKMEQTVQAMLPGRWRAKWDLEADRVRFELRPAFPKVLERDLDDVDDAVLPYAVDEDGRVIAWDMRSGSGTPHFLITGRTGTGKTVTLRTLVLEACRRAFEVWVCDPKRIEFIGLKAWPNVGLHASTVPTIVAAIHQARLEMERRYSLIEQGKAHSGDFPRLMLLIDEYRYLYGIVNAWWDQVKPSGPRVCPIFEEVFLIASLGRSAGVHLMLGTQRPDADWLGGDVRDQFGARMSMGRLSPEAARMMWGAHHIGVTVPLLTPGRGTSVGKDGHPVECQSYWTPDPNTATGDELEVLAKLRPTHVTHERKIVEPVELYDDEGEPLAPKGTYVHYLNAPLIPLSQRPDLEDYSPDPVAGLGLAATPAAEAGGDERGEAAHDWAQDDEAGGVDARDAYYAPEGQVPAHTLIGCSGYLVEVDSSLGLWAVIESAETDAVDEEQVCICWRSDEDGSDFGVLVVDASDRIGVRVPREEAEGKE